MTTPGPIDIASFKSGLAVSGYTIRNLIGRNIDFAVCTVIEDKGGTGIYWCTRDEYKFSNGQRAHLNAFNSRYDALRRGLLNSHGNIESLASCLYNALCAPDQKAEEAFAAIDNVILDARDTASSKTRVVYGISAAGTALVALAILGTQLQGFSDLDPKKFSSLGLLASASAGTVGALASVLEKLRKLEALRYPGALESGFAGGVRILVGIIFGTVAYTAAICGVALSALLSVSAGVLLIGFAGGASERLIPEIVEGLESSKTGSQQRGKKPRP